MCSPTLCLCPPLYYEIKLRFITGNTKINKSKGREVVLKRILICVFALGAIVVLSQVNLYEKVYVQMSDKYDECEVDVFEILDRRGELQILKNVYQEMIVNTDFEYIEVMDQPIEFVGEYDGPDNAIYGGIDCKNQQVDGMVVTPLDSLQVSNEFQQDLAIKDKISDGYCWTQDDFLWNENSDINIILGNSFKNSYDIGDYRFFERRRQL